MANDSATGGPLAPIPGGPAPLEGGALNDFLQQWVVGVCGLPGMLVRPSWQTEPPDLPDAATAWMAFGVTQRPSDTYPAVVHDGAGNNGQGQDVLHRHEDIDLLCSFYDTGEAGKATFYAAMLRDGCSIAQNIEVLQLAGFEFVSCGRLITVPTLVKTKWLYRVDLALAVRREVIRYYPVLNLLGVQGTLKTDQGFDRAITVTTD